MTSPASDVIVPMFPNLDMPRSLAAGVVGGFTISAGGPDQADPHPVKIENRGPGSIWLTYNGSADPVVNGAGTILIRPGGTFRLPPLGMFTVNDNRAFDPATGHWNATPGTNRWQSLVVRMVADVDTTYLISYI